MVVAVSLTLSTSMYWARELFWQDVDMLCVVLMAPLGLLVQVHAQRKNNKLDHKGLVFYWDTIHPDGVTGHRWGLGTRRHFAYDSAATLEHKAQLDCCKRLSAALHKNSLPCGSC